MYPEIRALVVSRFGNAEGVDVDDLVQEVATRITRYNGGPSAFDPRRSSFSHYVLLVASSKLSHMLGGATRREHRVTAVECEVLEAFAAPEPATVPPVDADAGTVGDIVEHLAELARAASVLGRDEFASGLRSAAELVGNAFDEGAPLPLQRRILALLAVCARPLSPGQVSAALLVPVGDVRRALHRLGGRIRRHNRGLCELAGATARPTRRGHPNQRRVATEAASVVVAMRLTPTEHARLEREAGRRKTTPGLLARKLVQEIHG